MLGDFKGYYQLIPGSYKSDKPIVFTGIDEIHLKCDSINGSFVKGIRESILYSFAPSSPPSDKIYKEPKIKPVKKINKPLLSHVLFSIEKNDRKPVDFKRERISFISH